MSESPSPTISLLTDFGVSDVYVGVMKGVMLCRAPEARIVDLTHNVPQGKILSAAYLLSTAWGYFPQGTVHTAVVDPGVGSERRVLAAEIEGHRFVAPDNGLLTMILDEARNPRVVSVERGDYFLSPLSRTFHGRDIFAPVAAALAGGAATLEELGPEAEDFIELDLAQPRRESDGSVVGKVLHADHFGNVITNIPGHLLPLQPRTHIRGKVITGLSRSYADVHPGDPLAVVGSTGRLEISIRSGDASFSYGVGEGDEVRVEKGVPHELHELDI